jgi:hypothetical protein
MLLACLIVNRILLGWEKRALGLRRGALLEVGLGMLKGRLQIEKRFRPKARPSPRVAQATLAVRDGALHLKNVSIWGVPPAGQNKGQ